jgi:transcriptional regulator GlxA family with amidase domain
MEQASQILLRQALQPVMLKEVAAELGLSPVRFTQRFKLHFGVTPIAYLTSLRLNKAKMLLLESNLTLDQIADCIGFQNGFYLNRLFARHLGMTPASYRKLHRV